MQNWLVNLAGMPRRFHELNLMQEHFNLWLEELAQHKGNEFGDTWYRDTLSMHVYNFLRLTDEMENSVELGTWTKTHTEPHLDNKLLAVIQICHEYDLHNMQRGCDFGFHTSNDFEQGYDRLGLGGKLKTYVDSWSIGVDNLEAEISISNGAEKKEASLHRPLSYIDGMIVVDDRKYAIPPSSEY